MDINSIPVVFLWLEGPQRGLNAVLPGKGKSARIVPLDARVSAEVSSVPAHNRRRILSKAAEHYIPKGCKMQLL